MILKANLRKANHITMKNKYKELFKDTIIFAVGNLGSKMILFFLVPLYTNYLTAEEYGTADLIFTVAQLVVPVVSLTIYDAVIRFGLDKKNRPEDVLKVGITIGIMGVICTVLITPIWNIYSPISAWKWYLCIYVIGSFALSILKSYLKVKGLNKRFAEASVLQTLIMALLNILFLVCYRTGVKGYMIANIVAVYTSVVISALWGRVFEDLKRSKFNRDLLCGMVRYSAPLILNDLSWWVIHSSDKFMIEAMIGATALGLYTVATKIPSLINVMISIFGQAWGISSIKEVESTNDTTFYTKVFEGYTYITFFSCLILVFIIKPFMSIYVGVDFRESWVFVPMLLVSAVFSAVSSYYGQMYGALKKSWNSMVSTVVAALVNIVANYYFIPIIGINGAVIGTVLAYIVLMLVRMVDVGKHINLSINYRRFALNCIVVMLQGLLVSNNFHILVTSVLSLIAFIIINRKTLMTFLKNW